MSGKRGRIFVGKGQKKKIEMRREIFSTHNERENGGECSAGEIKGGKLGDPKYGKQNKLIPFLGIFRIGPFELFHKR